jgi:hypothetical protein
MMYSDDINITGYILNNPQIYKTLLKSITLEERDFFGRFAMVWHKTALNLRASSNFTGRRVKQRLSRKSSYRYGTSRIRYGGAVSSGSGAEKGGASAEGA